MTHWPVSAVSAVVLSDLAQSPSSEFSRVVAPLGLRVTAKSCHFWPRRQRADDRAALRQWLFRHPAAHVARAVQKTHMYCFRIGTGVPLIEIAYHTLAIRYV